MEKQEIIRCIQSFEDIGVCPCHRENCRFIATSVMEYWNHRSQCTQTNEGLIICSVCGAWLENTKTALCRHLYYEHPTKLDNELYVMAERDFDSRRPSIILAIQKNQILVKCFVQSIETFKYIKCYEINCGFVCHTPKDAHEHMLTCRPQLYKRIPFSCSICQGKVNKESELKVHLEFSHTPPLIFSSNGGVGGSELGVPCSTTSAHKDPSQFMIFDVDSSSVFEISSDEEAGPPTSRLLEMLPTGVSSGSDQIKNSNRFALSEPVEMNRRTSTPLPASSQPEPSSFEIQGMQERNELSETNEESSAMSNTTGSESPSMEGSESSQCLEPFNTRRSLRKRQSVYATTPEPKVKKARKAKKKEIASMPPSRIRPSFMRSQLAAASTSDIDVDMDTPDPGAIVLSGLSSKRKPHEVSSVEANRMDSTNPLSNPTMMVECAVCFEKMPAIVYKQRHTFFHNFICWVTGEDPLPLADLGAIERHVNRQKARFPAFRFRCELCEFEPKSTRGLVSHRLFCGKSGKEMEAAMVTCKICLKIMKPFSLSTHNSLFHPQLLEASTSTGKKTSTEIATVSNETIDSLKECISEIPFETSLFPEDSELNCHYSSEATLLETTLKRLWEEAVKENKPVCCPNASCEFSADDFEEIEEHVERCCGKASIKRLFCVRCSYRAQSRGIMKIHVWGSHHLAAGHLASKIAFDEGKEAASCIPFLKRAELATMNFKKAKSWRGVFRPAFILTYKLRKHTYSKEQVLSSLLSDIEGWHLVSASESKKYLPKTTASAKYKFNGRFEPFLLFMPQIVNGVKYLFTGIPVFAMGWCPGDGDQYLAVSGINSMGANYEAGRTYEGPGLIQIWSLGQLSTEPTDTLPKIYLGIAHDFGAVMDLAWCPSGTRDETWMGLLGAATTSGSVPIYNVPWRNKLPTINESNDKFQVINRTPVLMLELPSSMKYSCRKISWSNVKPHNIVAAGYTNGVVAVWDLASTSSLLRNNGTLYPFRVINAHRSIVRGLLFSPLSNNVIATSSTDKSLKCWDLDDTSASISTTSKSAPVSDMCWLTHWMAVATCHDDTFVSSSRTVIYNYFREYVYSSQPMLSGINHSAWSISANDWINCVAASYDNGQVNVLFNFKLNPSSMDKRKYDKAVMTTKYHPFTKPKAKGSKEETCEMFHSRSYEDTIKAFGLDISIDTCTDSDSLKGSDVNRHDVYPLASASKVVWNPNMKSCTTLSIGTQGGLVVIPTINLISHDKKFIKSMTDFLENDV